MNRKLSVALAAIALPALAVQPTQANPGLWGTVTASPYFAPWLIGSVVCNGLTWAQQDAWAARQGRAVSHKERVHGFIGCAFPPIGFLKLIIHDAHPR